MGARGLSRITPRERRRRLFILVSFAVLMALAAVGTWWATRRPLLDELLLSRIPASLGGETRLEVDSVGFSGGRLKSVDHRREGWQVQARDVVASYTFSGLREGRLGEVVIGSLEVERTGPSPEGPLLPAMDLPVESFVVDRGRVKLPGAPGVVGFGVVTHQADTPGVVQVNAAMTPEGGRLEVDATWKPAEAAATVRFSGRWPEPWLWATGLVPGLALPPVEGLTFELPSWVDIDGVVDLVDGNLGAWGATFGLPEGTLTHEGREVPILGVQGAAQGRAAAITGLAAGVRFGRVAFGDVKVEPGVVALEGTLEGPWSVEIPSLVASTGVDGAGGRVEVAVRGTVTRLDEGTVEALARVSVAEGWNWEGVGGDAFGTEVTFADGTVSFRVPELPLTQPVNLRLEGLTGEVSGSVAAPSAQVSAVLDAGGLLPDWMEWEGARIPVVASLGADGRYEWFMPAFAIDTAMVAESLSLVAEGTLGGWLHGALADGPKGVGGEGSAKFNRLEAAVGEWRLGHGHVEIESRFGTLAPFLAEGSPGTGLEGLLRALREARFEAQAVGAFRDVQGAVGAVDVALQEVTYSVRHEPDSGLGLELSVPRGRVAGVPVGSVRLGVKAGLEGAPEVLVSAEVGEDSWPVRLVASPEGPLVKGLPGAMGVLAALGPVTREEQVRPPQFLRLGDDAPSWSGRMEATWAGTVKASGDVLGVLGAGLDEVTLVAADGSWRVEGVSVRLELAGGLDRSTWTTVEPVGIRADRIVVGEQEILEPSATVSVAGGVVEVRDVAARWLGGRVGVEPFRWTGAGGALSFRIKAEDIELGAIAALVEELPFSIAGRVVGSLEMAFGANGIVVKGGRLELVPGTTADLGLRAKGWLTARAAPGSAQYEALELVERAAQDLVVETMVVIIDPTPGEKPVRVSLAGRARDPAIEAPIQLDVNLDLDLDDLLNNRLWRSLGK